VDMQGFPPCEVSLRRLSYWEEVEVKRQINVLVDLGKMKPNNFEYACRVTLLVKKDGSRFFVETIDHSTHKPIGTHFQCHLWMMSLTN
jgi:hypothetical protein